MVDCFVSITSLDCGFLHCHERHSKFRESKLFLRRCCVLSIIGMDYFPGCVLYFNIPLLGADDFLHRGHDVKRGRCWAGPHAETESELKFPKSNSVFYRKPQTFSGSYAERTQSMAGRRHSSFLLIWSGLWIADRFRILQQSKEQLHSGCDFGLYM